MFLDILKEELADKGLDLCLNKTEIITTSQNHMVPLNAFENCESNQTGNFKLLGAPFGSSEYCNAHKGKRAGKAIRVLELTQEMEDRQAALHTIRTTCLIAQ